MERRIIPLAAVPILLVLLAGSSGAGDPALGSDDWKLDVVHLTNGRKLKGLVVEENSHHVLMKCVSRRPGSPTVILPEKLLRHEVKKIDLLGPEERALLFRRLEALRLEREMFLAQLEQLDPAAQDASPEAATFRPARWVHGEEPALEYTSTYFRLLTNSREEIAQLAVIHLEQVYAAYTRALPPRRQKAAPTTILLAGSQESYQKLARERGILVHNPAFYDVEKNQIVCVSDLDRLIDGLEESREKHRRLSALLDERRTQLRQLYKDSIPQVLLLPILETLNRIRQADKENTRTFQLAQQRLFQRLYHEAFHAYLASFVYPPREGEVPRWLNEGLAQIFETAIVEVGELRVGHVGKERVEVLRAAIARGALPALQDLLRSGPEDFLAFHRARQQTEEQQGRLSQYYLGSWALAFYLTFERQVIGTELMDDYVRSLKHGADPVAAFRAFVGQPLEEVEKDFQVYLTRIRPDGGFPR